jgi:formylglycine-generating enzyme required for sulfatase activity
MFLSAVVSTAALGCRERSSPPLPLASAAPSASGGFGPPALAPAPRKGMVWIPKGALVAGTSADSLPRIADEEMGGEQLILEGFHIDVFPYPNEEGAIPLTNVAKPEAAVLCAEQHKRLCTELEWERACKGPNNTTYPYGATYQPERCGTGAAPRLRPNGHRVACRSEFGVRDLHGGVWEWTDSKWGRGSTRDLATVRGGNAQAGELVGRCANAMGRPPDQKYDVVGFRCCAGPRNEAEVVLHVMRGKHLEHLTRIDREFVQELLARLPEDARHDLTEPKDFTADRMFIWRPIGNEELIGVGGCQGLARRPACGVIIARRVLDAPQVLAWISSGHWVPAIHSDHDPRDLWIFGGDELGGFRRLLAYVWGRVSVGTKERRLPKPPKSTSRKKRK